MTFHPILTHLVTLWRGLNIPGLQVVDGPIYDPNIHFLAVGWDRTDQPAVVASNTSVDMDERTGLEALDVSSLLSMWLGKTGEVAVVRADLSTAFAAIKAALVADHSLGGLADSAWISGYDYTPDEGEGGDQVDLRFTTHIEAYIND